MELEGKSVGEAEKHPATMETTLAHTLGVGFVNPLLVFQLARHAAGFEDTQQFCGSRLSCGHMPPFVPGIPRQYSEAHCAALISRWFARVGESERYGRHLRPTVASENAHVAMRC
jgi:hypothetical protein